MPGKHPNSIVVVVAAALMVGSVVAEDRHERHRHQFANDVNAFHSALAPLWHAQSGKERSQKVCAQATQLESLAREIRSADSRPLLASVTALKAKCQVNPADIDGAFSQVHDAFHRLAEPNGY
jgi:hypothetical protein